MNENKANYGTQKASKNCSYTHLVIPKKADCLIEKKKCLDVLKQLPIILIEQHPSTIIAGISSTCAIMKILGCMLNGIFL